MVAAAGVSLAKFLAAPMIVPADDDGCADGAGSDGKRQYSAVWGDEHVVAVGVAAMLPQALPKAIRVRRGDFSGMGSGPARKCGGRKRSCNRSGRRWN